MAGGQLIPMRISPAVAKERIAACALDSSKVYFTTHAIARSKLRRITRRQVLNCLGHGLFIEGPSWDQTKGGSKFTMETVDAGDTVRVAAALHRQESGDQVVVVTVF